MNAPPKLSVVEQLRAQDGDDCWLRGAKLGLRPRATAGKCGPRSIRWRSRSAEATNSANLVLCHPGCNKQLGNRPVADMQKMRAKVVVNRAGLAGKKA